MLKRIALASKVDALDAEGLLDKDKFDILVTSTSLPVDEVLCMCEMYVHLNEIVGALIVIDAALKEKIAHQHVIQEKIPRSFIVAKQLIDSLVQRLAVHANMYSSVDTPDKPWAVSLADVRRWLTGAKDFVQAAHHKCIDALVDDLSDSSQGVLKMTPRCDHFVTKTTYNKRMAKQYLLDWPQRDRLQEMCLALFHSLAQLGSVHKRLFGEEPLFENERWRGAVRAAEAVFAQAKLVITVIAACSVCQEQKGPEQIQKAAQLLETKSEVLPDALLLELGGITAGAAMRQKRQRKDDVEMDTQAESGSRPKRGKQ